MAAKTRGVVLAGQHAWRDSKFDRLSPRPLLPVANRPLFSYAVNWLLAAGIREVTLSINAETRALSEALSELPDGAGLTLAEDRAPRGPAGCVRDAVVATDAETVLVVDGTIVPTADLVAVLECHNSAEAVATVLVHPEPGQPAESGRYLPGGVYVFARSAIERVSPRGFHDIKEGLLPRLYRAGERTAAFVAPEVSPRPLDGPSYLALNDWVIERSAGLPRPDGYAYRAGALCHETARISPQVVFLGPVVVGPRAQVMAGATVVGPTSIGADSTIAAGALVSRSAVWKRCTIGADAVADRSILPNACEVPPGVWALGQVLDPSRAGAETPLAPVRRARAALLGFRPDAIFSK